jgi:hypothetical protein
MRRRRITCSGLNHFQRRKLSERSSSNRPESQKKLAATICNYSQLLASGGKGRPCERRKSKVERRSSSVTSTMEDGKSRQRLRAWNGAHYRGMPRKRNYRRKRRNEVLTTRCSNQ